MMTLEHSKNGGCKRTTQESHCSIHLYMIKGSLWEGEKGGGGGEGLTE